jgi:hypothetical protein
MRNPGTLKSDTERLAATVQERAMADALQELIDVLEIAGPLAGKRPKE